jgi:hypothetical protein
VNKSASFNNTLESLEISHNKEKRRIWCKDGLLSSIRVYSRFDKVQTYKIETMMMENINEKLDYLISIDENDVLRSKLTKVLDDYSQNFLNDILQF